MKIILVLIILLGSLQATSLSNLSYRQKQTLQYVYSRAKEFHLELTMTAIAWQESQFGKYTLSLSDPSCGIFHVMPATLAKDTNINPTKWNQSRLCERLIFDRDFSFSAALVVLKYWQNYWESKNVPRVWSHMVASYNGGFDINIGTNKYLKHIIHKVRLLKAYLRRNKR